MLIIIENIAFLNTYKIIYLYYLMDIEMGKLIKIKIK